MGKEPPMKRQGIRYGPYSGSFLTRRGRGSTPPDSRGIRAGSRRAQLNGSISDLLEDVNTRCGGRDLREVFRGHANQPGALGQAIKTWIQYDEIRGPRQPEPADCLKTRHNNQSNWSSVREPIPGDESRNSQPPVGHPDVRHTPPPHQFSEHPNAPTTDENYLQRSRQAPLFNSTPPGERLFAGPPNSPCTHAVRTDSRVIDSPQLGSVLRITRGVAAPPLVSLPPFKESAVHGSSNRSEESLVIGHNEQDCISHRNSEESVHAAFWETAGWTPETGYPGFSEEGYRIPTHLKGKGRGRLHGPNKGGQAPEEQGFSGWKPPQPGNPIYGIPFPESTASRLDVEPAASTRTPIKIEPQDEGSIPIALHQEQGEQDLYEHEQPPAQTQPPPRRSARIKAMNKRQDAVPPMVKTSAKSTGRKRAVRKK